jgi:hypothetical protein
MAEPTDEQIQAWADEAEKGYPTDDRLARLQVEAQQAERVEQLSVTLVEFKIMIGELLLRRHGIDPNEPEGPEQPVKYTRCTTCGIEYEGEYALADFDQHVRDTGHPEYTDDRPSPGGYR